MISKSAIEKKNLRTAARAGNINRNYPNNKYPIITLPGYKYGMSFFRDADNDLAYLIKLPQNPILKLSNGKILGHSSDNRQVPVDDIYLINLSSGQSIKNIDLPLLHSFFAIYLKNYEINGVTNDTISLYLPDFTTYIGHGAQKNISNDTVDTIIHKTQMYQNVTGALKSARGYSSYQVLSSVEYDNHRNVISITSPYMNQLIMAIHSASQEKSNDQSKKTGTKVVSNKPRPAYSYLVHPDIAIERNKSAVENVFLIIQLIAACGNNDPNIKASRLISRNSILMEQLRSTTNVNQTLARAFKKTWELLRTHTDLTSKSNICLPDPNDADFIPTRSNSDTLVFRFPHKPD